MSGTSLGALRSGRYATRSNSTATPTDTAMPDTNKIASAMMGWLSRKPLREYALAKKNDANAPNMNTSPWAKLIMRKMP